MHIQIKLLDRKIRLGSKDTKNVSPYLFSILGLAHESGTYIWGKDKKEDLIILRAELKKRVKDMLNTRDVSTLPYRKMHKTLYPIFGEDVTLYMANAIDWKIELTYKLYGYVDYALEHGEDIDITVEAKHTFERRFAAPPGHDFG